MEIDKLQNNRQDAQIAVLLDNILDSVLALKARLKDSNMDSNSIGGANFFTGKPYNYLKHFWFRFFSRCVN